MTTSNEPVPAAFAYLPVPPTFFQVPFTSVPRGRIHASFKTSPSLSFLAQCPQPCIFPSGLEISVPPHSPAARWKGAAGSSLTMTLLCRNVVSVVPFETSLGSQAIILLILLPAHFAAKVMVGMLKQINATLTHMSFLLVSMLPPPIKLRMGRQN